MKIFCWLGAAIGLAMGSFPGAIAGFFAGLMIDAIFSGGSRTYTQTTQQRTQQGGYQRPQAQDGRTMFIKYLTLMSAHLVFADGRIYQTETDILKEFLRQNFGADGVQIGMNYFTELRAKHRQQTPTQWNASVRSVCNTLKMLDESTRLQILAYLAEIAKSDGRVDTTEIKALKEIAMYMGMDTSTVEQMLALGGQSLDEAYKVLGVSPNATDDEVRKAYKKMVLKHHPDRVAHLGEDVKNAATKKMQEINKAKDLIYQSRHMN